MVYRAELDDWYLWRRRGMRKIMPWQREYLEFEFLKTEIQRVKAVTKWWHTYKTATRNTMMEDVEMYVLPTKYNKTIELPEGQYIVALSALKNSVQCPVMAIFDHTTYKPKDYQFIHIVRGKVGYIFAKNDVPIKVLYAEEYSELDSLSIYQKQTPHPGTLNEFFRKNFVKSVPYPSSFESIMLGSPPVHLVGGGISLASEFNAKSKAEEICLSLQYVLPPELRGIAPPPSVSRGTWDEIEPGIEGKVAEQVIGVNSTLITHVDESITGLINQAKMRNNYRGELSMAGGLYHQSIDTMDDANRLISSFFSFDISLSGLDDILEYTTPVNTMISMVDEELWNTIVTQREKSPSAQEVQSRINSKGDELISWLKSELKPKSQFAFAMVSRTGGHIPEIIRRDSQAIARSLYHDQVTDEDVDSAYYNLQKRVDIGFSEEDKRGLDEVLPSPRGKHEMKRVKMLLVTSTLLNQPSTIDELWQAVENHNIIESKSELTILIDSLHRDGIIYIGKDGRYWKTPD